MPPTTTPPPPILIPRPPLTTPLDPTLLSTLQTALLTPTIIKRLRTTLEKETQAAGWQERVKERTMQLLGSREFWKWEELVGSVVREARGVEEEGEEEGGEGEGEGEGGNEGKDGDGEEKIDIKIPEKAVTEAAKVVKGVLDSKIELEAEGKGYWD